jgi:hypothetical protein
MIEQLNSLIEAVQPLTLNEKRLVLLAFHQVDAWEPFDVAAREPLVVTVKATDWANYYGSGRDAYPQMYKAMKRLSTRSVNPDGGPEDLNWTDKTPSQATLKGGSVTFTLGYSLSLYIRGKKHWLAGKEGFTGFRLENVAQLKTLASLRMYEVLAQYAKSKHKSRTMTVEQLRGIVDPHSKYQRFAEVNRNQLKPAIEEINEKTDLIVEVIDIDKLGNNIIGYKFSIKKGKDI